MSFNNMLPLHVSDLRKRVKQNQHEIFELREPFHDCNCEFCDRYNDGLDFDDIETQIEELEEENKLINQTIARLKIYAKDRGIDLGEAENARS